MAELFTNLSTSTLASGIVSTDTSLTVQAGDGAKYPAPTSGDIFRAVLFKKSTGGIEIITCTARSADVLTVTRGEEGTTALEFLAGDLIELRPTAAFFSSLNVTDSSIQVNQFTTASADTGVADAYACGLSPAVTVINTGLELNFTPLNTNTGASTIAVDGLPIESIIRRDGAALQAGDLTANIPIGVRYDGANFRIGLVDYLAKDNTFTGNNTFTSVITGDVTGSSGTTTKLATARTIGGVSFDGSANINLAGVNTAGNQDTSGVAASITSQGNLATLNNISQSQLNTALQSLSISKAAGDATSSVYAVASGGSYQRLGDQAYSTGDTSAAISNKVQTDASYTSYVGLSAGAIDVYGAAGTAYMQHRYVTACPPYNNGFGDIPLFIFAVIDNITMDISALSVSIDPPWANNGKTDIRPDLYTVGSSTPNIKLVNEYKMLNASYANDLNTAILNKDYKSLNAILDGIDSAKYLEVEINAAYKNIDMQDIPQPFEKYDNGDGKGLAGKTIVVLNPQANDMRILCGVGNSLEDKVSELIHDNAIKLISNPIDRGFHKSVPCLDFSLR